MKRKITMADLGMALGVLVFGGIFITIVLTSPTLNYEGCMQSDKNSTVVNVRLIKDTGSQEYAADLENGKTALVHIPVYAGDNYCKTFKI